MTRIVSFLICLLFLAASAEARPLTVGQNEILDASSARKTIPNRVGLASNMPNSCTRGETYFQADQTQLCVCGTGETFECNFGGGGGGGPVSFSDVTAGSSTTALVVGSGGSLGATGTGTITATGVDAVGAAPIVIGSGDVTSVTLTTDGTGTGEVVLPAGSIDSTEILDGTIATVDLADAAVTLAKMANLAQARIIGRQETAGTGVPEALTPAQARAAADLGAFASLSTDVPSADLNSITESGVYYAASGATNAPNGTDPFMVYANKGGPGALVQSQIAVSLLTGVSYSRRDFIGTWSAWQTGAALAADGEVDAAKAVNAADPRLDAEVDPTGFANGDVAVFGPTGIVEPGGQPISSFDGLSGAASFAQLPDDATAGLPLVSGGAGNPSYGPPDRSKYFEVVEEFCANQIGTASGLATVQLDFQWFINRSVSAQVLSLSGFNRPCAFQVAIGATAGDQFTTLYLGSAGGSHSFPLLPEAAWRTAVAANAASAGDDTYDIIAGFCLSNPGVHTTDCVRGAYFEFTAASSNWRYCTDNAGTPTCVATAVAPLATGNTAALQELAIVVNAAGTGVTFYIAGAAVSGVVTTEFPTAPVPIQYRIQRRAGAIGTATPGLIISHMQYAGPVQ